MKMVGERPLNAVMESVADVRKVKVKEAYEKATVKCKASAPRAPAPVAQKGATKASKSKPAEEPSKKGADTLLVDDEPSKKPAAKPPARLLVRSSSVVNLFYRS